MARQSSSALSSEARWFSHWTSHALRTKVPRPIVSLSPNRNLDGPRTAAWGTVRVERLNEAAERRTLARDNIWQGNCHAFDQRLCSNSACSSIASLRITISIEYPISNCPAKFGAASFKRLYPK